ncbi:serine/threonine protein kinase [Mycobacteroides abscessus subsp. abscessus]|nr:serine/threonine-protein kinase [Mycobacteroides abscessus]SIH34971.1 serine/threonine protein kinase [Mycobacteroides abscessus subsp. abscessus]
MVLSDGTVVSGYRIEGVLGSGGMGTVYLAKNPVLPRHDALKVLSSELSNDEHFRARFTREADLAAGLDHPNIVTVYNRGETDDGQLWIAMQYVAGSDANRELELGRMTVKRAVHITSEVAKALDYAHKRHDLIHRDVKPANFLLTEGDERVMLADFGIARARDEAHGLTMTGTVMATVAYAAPETLSDAPVDGRADIYALGCSLFRMVTGKTPFGSAGTMAAVMAAHLTQPPPRITAEVPDAPPGLDAVIAKAMAKDPDERYQSAQALADAAREAIADGATTPVSRPVQPQHYQGHYPGYSSGPNQPGAPDYPSGFFSGAAHMPPAYAQPGSSGGGNTAPTTMAPFPGTQHGHGAAGYSPPRKPRRGMIVGVLAAVVVLVAAGTSTWVFWGGNGQTDKPYQAQTFNHVHGSTEIKTKPHAVAAVGAGDADAVLSLGVQPVVMTMANGLVPTWLQSSVSGTPKVLTSIDPAAIVTAKPDVIIATSDITDAVYTQLAAIAPTITRPQDQGSGQWSWQDQLQWIGKIVGADDKAKQLVDSTRSEMDKLRGDHPAFKGKTVVMVAVTDDGVSGYLGDTRIVAYLQDLGFGYAPKLQRAGDDVGDFRAITSLAEWSLGPTSAVIAVRTDKYAGKGGFGNLPSEFGIYKGDLVIIDDPKVIEAFSPNGYAATQFLNGSFVDSLAQSIR